MESKYKYILYFIGTLYIFYIINPSIKDFLKNTLKLSSEHEELVWLVDLIILILFYTFVKSKPLVFIINILIIVFMILAYFNNYILLEKCDKTGKGFQRFIVISVLCLGIYLYLNKNSTIGDCSLLAFSKLIILLSCILSFMYSLDDLLVFTIILFLYVNKLV